MKYFFYFVIFEATKHGRTNFSPLLFCCCCWIQDPRSGIGDPGSEMDKNQDPDKHAGSATMVEQNLMFSFCSRELTYHFVKSGHKPTAAIACECGRRFHGGPSGAYRYHR
jgi:hypothetical protein